MTRGDAGGAGARTAQAGAGPFDMTEPPSRESRGHTVSYIRKRVKVENQGQAPYFGKLRDIALPKAASEQLGG